MIVMFHGLEISFSMNKNGFLSLFDSRSFFRLLTRFYSTISMTNVRHVKVMISFIRFAKSDLDLQINTPTSNSTT